ncbi:hypothetical protein KR044_000700 [Drosophila immigrans]|nr:hypothetical protein KR044_000700 [Drosophila immigrans]
MLRRPITSGSRQAPDPYDQFLESRSMYRKHTARDASCLFRVIAEQMYDTQMLHFEVRLECVRFMTRKRRIFEQHVRGDFDAYMLDMAKPKTYGTMLELRALCCMYRRNVILFEPYNMGTKVTYNERYQDNFLVFYTNEFHFDSVYTEEYIEMAAICQSICFKLLYKMLFKLPDVNFAVETMLHPQSFNWNSYNVELDSRGYISRVICADGRGFQLDMPEDTKCILENYKLCHFHSNGVQPLMPPPDAASSRSLVESADMLHMCPSRLNSCVRQLLEEGITPFPYKVAKSLDPFMYRNIEFDSWNDMRKEAKRFNIYANDYNFKVHYEALHPVPPDEFRPWSVPFRYQRQLQRVHLAKLMSKPKTAHKWKKAKLFEIGKYFEAGKCEVMQYMQLDACYGYPQPQQAIEEQQQQQQQQEQQQRDREQRFQQRGKQSPRLPQSQQEQPLSPPAAPVAAAPYLNYMSPMAAGRRRLSHVSPPWPTAHEEYSAAGVYPPMQPNGCMLMHYGGFAPPGTAAPQATLPPPPPPPSTYAPSSPPYLFAQQPAMPPHTMLVSPPLANRSGNGNTSTTATTAAAAAGATSKHGGDDQQPPPSDVRRSLHEDLPADLSTVRYFYNIGVNTHLGYLNGSNQSPQHNTDQQQQQQKAAGALMAANTSTPPPTPDANATVSGIKSTSSASSTEVVAGSSSSVDKTRASRAKRAAGAFNKGRPKRPEQLYVLNKDNNPLAAHHTVLLPTPTPTPSPNTPNGNQFNFYPTVQQAPVPPSAHQSMSLRPPIFYAAPKAGQDPYGWGLPPPPNMVGMPFEMISMELNAQKPQQQQQQSQAGGYNAASRH